LFVVSFGVGARWPGFTLEREFRHVLWSIDLDSDFSRSVQTVDPIAVVPKTSGSDDDERTFVIREKNGKAEWVNISKGVADGDFVEVIGRILVRKLQHNLMAAPAVLSAEMMHSFIVFLFVQSAWHFCKTLEVRSRLG
jgi:hypothetical protein